jgi:hypothetical protein
MSATAAIHIVSPAEFDGATARRQAPNAARQFAPAMGIDSAIWGGVFEVVPGARTGIHHHGEQQTIIYVLSGTSEIRWGDAGDGARKSWLFHSCPRLPSAHGNQPFQAGAVSMGCRAEHPNAGRRQPSRRHLAVSRNSLQQKHNAKVTGWKLVS